MKRLRIATLLHVVGAIQRNDRVLKSRCIASIRNTVGAGLEGVSDREIRSCIRQLRDAGVVALCGGLIWRNIRNYHTGNVRSYRRFMKWYALNKPESYERFSLKESEA